MLKRDRIAAVVSALLLSLAAITQASAKPVTGGVGDLVADYAAGRANLDQIRDDELPPALRDLPKPARSAALEQQSNERKGLSTKLADLFAKRDAYVAEQQAKQQPRTGTFEQAVAATLKAQIKELKGKP